MFALQYRSQDEELLTACVKDMNLVSKPLGMLGSAVVLLAPFIDHPTHDAMNVLARLEHMKMKNCDKVRSVKSILAKEKKKGGFVGPLRGSQCQIWMELLVASRPCISETGSI